MADRNAKRLCGLFHRARGRLASAPATLVRPGNHQRDLVAGTYQRSEHHRGRSGGTQKTEPQGYQPPRARTLREPTHDGLPADTARSGRTRRGVLTQQLYPEYPRCVYDSACPMTGQYFEAEPSVASRPGTVELRLADWQATLQVDRGVFSTYRVDPGTLALLHTSVPVPSGHLLDLGCGYGPIALTLARRSPASTVWAVDVNQRSVELTARNAVALGLTNVVAVLPGQVPESVKMAGIWSNPPVRVGKKNLHDLLARWLVRLDAGGFARLVVHKHLGGDSLATWLREQGWVVHRSGSKQGYRLLEVRAGDARRLGDSAPVPGGAAVPAGGGAAPEEETW